ncbi:MAG: UTP--glucose-1-phosphate uridylyltransferase [Simkaniaceae bacterium]|nr:UTP--glucose-1-phosphate uridylyltransferase [Simkaniaceae bacterium]
MQRCSVQEITPLLDVFYTFVYTAVLMSQITLTQLHDLAKTLKRADNPLDILNRLPRICEVYETLGYELSAEHEILVKQVIACGQEHIFEGLHASDLPQLILDLMGMDRFYDAIGGIVGYQEEVLKLLSGKRKDEVDYLPPQGIDLEDRKVSLEMMEAGLEKLGEMAEFYPVGGAADRLGLVDEKSGEMLPAACLNFLGRSLLEGLIRDLQAREYLHFKRYGKQLTTPIAMMTSDEKDNHAKITGICASKGWFGRGKERFRLFSQPKVPAFNRRGRWFCNSDGTLLWKPGGHGVIWRLAQLSGVFDWLDQMGRSKGLVRQINNPIAGVDLGLLSFCGVGLKEDHLFGFACCPRRENAKEGVNVVKVFDSGKCALSNVEYCDLTRKKTLEHTKNLTYYPANANILFVDLEAVREAIVRNPYPGEILNFKHTNERTVARLELTMQNLAEEIDQGKNAERAYLTLGARNKTLCATKRSYTGDLLETPEGAYTTVIANNRELLSLCGFTLPEYEGASDYSKSRPSVVFLYHPALGPVYEEIGKKLKGGSIQNGGELQLEIAEVTMSNCHIDGSVLIETDNVLGHFVDGKLVYSDRAAQLKVENVTFKNQGRAHAGSCYWKNEIQRTERFYAKLEEGSELVISDVTLEGDMEIHVEKGMRLTIDKKGKRYERRDG